MQRGRGYYRPNPRNPHNNYNNRRPRGEPAVEDLRAKLNRMKLEKEKALNNEGVVKNPPPPDPAYNFLKDPLRGDSCAQTTNAKKIGNNKEQSNKPESKESDKEQKSSAEVAEKSSQKQRSVRFAEDANPVQVPPPSPRGRGEPRPNWRTPYHAQRRATNNNNNDTNNFKEKKEQTPKQQSVHSIKIEVSSESGERKCTFDESKTIDVPVVPKKNYTVKPKSGQRWPYRGPHRYGGRFNNSRSGGFSSDNPSSRINNNNRRNFKNKKENHLKNEEINKNGQADENVVEDNQEKSDTNNECNEEAKTELKIADDAVKSHVNTDTSEETSESKD